MSNKINWVKIMEDNRDKIEETIREAKKETYGTMQGWHVDVEMDEDGEVWTSGLASHGSQSMSGWEGKTYIVCSIESWNIELDEDEEIKHDEKLYAEYLAQKEDENGYEYAYEFMRKKYPDVLQEWQENAKDYELSEFDPSELLDRAIEDERVYHQFS